MTRNERTGLRWPNYVPVGVSHHATFQTQSPPHTTTEYRDFLRGEIDRISETGFSAFVLECGWNDVEVAEDVWDFSRCDIAYELCRDRGLALGLWIFTELTPTWVAHLHPNVLAIAASGYRSDSHSYADEDARSLVRRLIQKVLARYGHDPLVIGCNIGIESGFHWLQSPDSNRYSDSLFDYNPASIRHYRQWLKRRYQSLENASLAHRCTYFHWATIEPPRARPLHECARMRSSHVPWLDWRLSQCDMMTEYLSFKAACVREAAPHLPVSDQSYEINPARGGQDLWSIAHAMDIVGTSMFTSNAPGDYMRGNFLQDYHRSSSKGLPFWIWELRAGQNAWGVTNWGPMVSAADIGRFTWQVLGQGAKAVFYWNWRPHLGGVEVGGHGFTQRDGAVTDRAIRAGGIARALKEPGKNLLGFHMPAAQIAILDSPSSRIVAEGEDGDSVVVDAQRGLYSLWKAQGYAIDFLSEDELQSGALDKYKVLGLPFQYLMATETARVIAEWTTRGGALFGGIWCGAKDDLGYGQPVVPGHGLDAVFGGRQIMVEPIFSENDAQVTNFGAAWNVGITGRPGFRWVDWPNGDGPTEEPAVGLRYAATLLPYQGARVLAVNDREEPTILWNDYGAGHAVLFGSLPISENEFAPSGLAALLAAIAKNAGVVPAAEVRHRAGRRLEAKLLLGEQGEAIVVALNLEPQEILMEIYVPGISAVQARDFETDEVLSVEPCNSGVMVRLLVKAGDGRAAILSERHEVRA